jgi:hypothetical protein
LNHPEQEEAIFAITLPPVDALNRECGVKGEPGHLEAYAVGGLLGGFVVIPREVIIAQILRLGRIRQDCRG